MSLFRSPAEQFILYATEVFSDGHGDAKHLADFFAFHKNIPAFHLKAPLMILLCAQESLLPIQETLKSRDINLLDPNIHIVTYAPSESLGVRAAPGVFNKYLETNVLLQSQLQKTLGMFCISTLSFAVNGVDFLKPKNAPAIELTSYLEKVNIFFPCKTITEHGAGIAHDGFYCMGVGPGNVGIKIEEMKVDPVVALMKIKNEKFLSALFNTPLEHKREPDKFQKFLAENLLIPAYFQEGPQEAEELINAAVASPLAKEYKEVTVVMNKGQTYEDVRGYAESMPADIASLTIVRKDERGELKEHTIDNPSTKVKSVSAKRVRILEGWWLDNADYQSLQESAQLFLGCSGDNSFEMAISLRLIPLLQLRVYKANVGIDFKGYLEARHPAAELVREFVECLLNKYDFYDAKLSYQDLSIKMAKIFNQEFVLQWKAVLADLFENHNCYRNLPTLAKELLATPSLGVDKRLPPTSSF